MKTLFLEVFGPFIFFGTIYSLVLLFRRWRGHQSEPNSKAPEEEEPGTNGPEDGAD